MPSAVFFVEQRATKGSLLTFVATAAIRRNEVEPDSCGVEGSECLRFCGGGFF